MKKSNHTNVVLGLLSLLVGIVASINIFTNNGFSFHDEAQIAYLFEYSKVIGLGQFPPRWAPDMHFTYGSPFPEFNYQLPYYLGSLLHGIGFSLLDAYKLVLGFTFILGAVGIYLLGKSISGPIAGFAASILFTFTPYRAVDVFVRGTVGESLAIAIYPWIVYSLIKLKERPGLMRIILVALSVSALLLTHQPASVFGLPIIIGIFFVSEIINKNYQFILNLFISLTVTLCLSAYYLLPILFENNLITPLSPFNFYDHFPFIWQLFYSKWGYGSSNWGPYDDLSFQVGLANLAVIALSCIVFARLLILKKKHENTYFYGTFLGIIITFFLMNNRSTFLWKVFPYTNLIQFPWRLLAIMSFLTTLLYLYLLKASKGTLLKLLLFVIPTVAIISSATYFHPGTIIDHSDQYYLRRYLPNQVLNEGEKVSKEYLNFTEESIPVPITAIRPVDAPNQIITPRGVETKIDIIDSNPFNTIARINSSEGDFVTIHRFHFPGWVVKIDGVIQKVALNANGAMLVFSPKGVHTLSLTYKDTSVRYYGNLISIISILASIIVTVKYIKNQHGLKK